MMVVPITLCPAGCFFHPHSRYARDAPPAISSINIMAKNVVGKASEEVSE